MSQHYANSTGGPIVSGVITATVPPHANTTAPEEKKILSYSGFASQLGFLEGKVLTIIDAAFADKEQRKAVKDLIRAQFREQRKWVSTFSNEGRLICDGDEPMPPTNS